MQDTMQKVRALARVQAIVARVELRAHARQGAVFVVALVMLLLALAMLNLAIFMALHERIGPVWAATVMAFADAVLAGILVSVANKIEPGAEAETARDVRKVLLDDLATDAETLQADLSQARDDVQRIRGGFAALTGGVKGLGPVVDLLTGALRGSKKKKPK